MKVKVAVKDIVYEMDFSSDELSAFLNPKTGELATISDEAFSAAEEEELDLNEYPEWLRDMILKARDVLESDDYLSLPDKFDIHEYGIMERFCISMEDDAISKDLLNRIRGKGAMDEYGLTKEWYDFRQNELERIAIDWLESHQIPYTNE